MEKKMRKLIFRVEKLIKIENLLENPIKQNLIG